MHHAYLILGSREEAERYLQDFLKRQGLTLAGNPDVLRYESESLGVDDAREVRERALEKAFGERRIIILAAERFTPEAQNALLKTLEEPIEHTNFFILGAERALFLPTLLSRVLVVEVAREERGSGAEKFLSLAPAKRLDFAKNFEGSLPDLLDELLLDLKSKNIPLNRLRGVFDLRLYASDPAVSARLILEHLALTL